MPISGDGAALYRPFMLRTMRQMHGQWATLGAAWLLVVQLLIGGFMQGAAAAPANAAGDFLGIICSSNGAAPVSPGGPADHSRSPACCTLGCPALAAFGYLPVDAVRLAPARIADIAVTYDTGSYSPATVERSSARARAPPLPTI